MAISRLMSQAKRKDKKVRKQKLERVQFLARKGDETFQLEIVEGRLLEIEIIRELNRLLNEGYTLEKVGA